MQTTYPTLSDDRHSLLCVSEVIKLVINNDGRDVTGAAELADKALREVINRMGAVEDGAVRLDRGAPAGIFAEIVETAARLKADHDAMQKDAPGEEAAYYAWGDALEAVIGCPVSTPAALLEKLEHFEAFQAYSSVWVDETEDFVKRQVAGLLADVRRVLSCGSQPFAKIDPAAIIPEPGKEHFFVKPYGTAEDGGFAESLANFLKAKRLLERQPVGTEQKPAAAEEADEAFAHLIGWNASTPAELHAKMEAFEGWCLNYDIPDERSEQITAIFDDVRRLLASLSADPSPEVAARVQAWRQARDRCIADHHESDALSDAKRDAYHAITEVPIQSIGDLAALARAMIEEDDIEDGRAMAPYDPAFAALFAGIEALAGGEG